MPRSPDDPRQRMMVKQRDRNLVVRVPARLVGQPPRRVRVNRHFLSVRKNATPSNFGLVGSPTARASASSRVMRGRVFSASLRFGLRAAVFIGAQKYCGCGVGSSGARLKFTNNQSVPRSMRKASPVHTRPGTSAARWTRSTWRWRSHSERRSFAHSISGRRRWRVPPG